MLLTQAPMTLNKSSQSTRAAFPAGERDVAQERAATEADLERLKKLINDAAGPLLGRFNEFAALEAKTSRDHEERRRIAITIDSAVTALQFQDMADQLTAHAAAPRGRGKLSAVVVWPNARRETAAAEHSQPVQQTEMSAGSVDLFKESTRRAALARE